MGCLPGGVGVCTPGRVLDVVPAWPLGSRLAGRADVPSRAVPSIQAACNRCDLVMINQPGWLEQM